MMIELLVEISRWRQCAVSEATFACGDEACSRAAPEGHSYKSTKSNKKQSEDADRAV